MNIEKKIWPEYFEKVASGEKTCELRLADWECKPGDTLLLREWNPKTKHYTGRHIEKTVTHVMKTKDVRLFPQEDVEKYGYQIISLHDPKHLLEELEVDPEDLEVETDENKKTNGAQGTVKNVSFAIGGLTIGVALGAGTLSIAQPNLCPVSAVIPAATTTQNVPSMPETTPQSSTVPTVGGAQSTASMATSSANSGAR